MIEHVYKRANMFSGSKKTYVATPDKKIQNLVQDFGGNTIITGQHDQPQERVAEAIKNLNIDNVIIVLGDEPLIYPEMLENISAALEKSNSSTICSRLGSRYESKEEFRKKSEIKVVTDINSKVLYCSREAVPSTYNKKFNQINAYKQIGISGYKKDSLLKISRSKPTPLETTEMIFPLRILEKGYNIQLVSCERRVKSVNTQADLEIVQHMMTDDKLFSRYASKS